MITVYSSTTCSKCQEAKSKLKEAGVEFEEILLDNIEKQKSLRLLLASLHADNVTTLPVFYVNKKGLEWIEVDVDKLI